MQLSGRWRRKGGVFALIKFEFPTLGREAAGLLSHHPETLPSRCGSMASSIQSHCHMNNHTAVALDMLKGFEVCVSKDGEMEEKAEKQTGGC